MTDIAAHAARLAEAREHWHCRHGSPTYIAEQIPHMHGGKDCDGDYYRCHDDHRTPAERSAAALDAAAVLWEYAGRDDWIEALYDAIRGADTPLALTFHGGAIQREEVKPNA